MLEFKRPDWKHWQQMPEALLWQCVALTCAIDPYAVSLKRFRARRYSPAHPDDAGLRVPNEKFLSRLKIASAYLGKAFGLLRGGYGPETCVVSLPELIQFARDAQWDYPPELDRLQIISRRTEI